MQSGSEFLNPERINDKSPKFLDSDSKLLQPTESISQQFVIDTEHKMSEESLLDDFAFAEAKMETGMPLSVPDSKVK